MSSEWGPSVLAVGAADWKSAQWADVLLAGGARGCQLARCYIGCDGSPGNFDRKAHAAGMGKLTKIFVYCVQNISARAGSCACGTPKD